MTPSLLLGCVFAAAGLLILLVSLPLVGRRVGPNPLYGLRIPSTLRDQDIWYEANAMAGRYFAVVGLVTLAAGLTGGVAGLAPRMLGLGCSLVLLASTAIAAVMSVRFANRIHRDGPPG